MRESRNGHIVVNARFLTRRITGLERYGIELSKAIKKLYPDVKFVAPRDVMHVDVGKTLGVETFGRLQGHFWEQIELPVYLRKNGSPLLINPVNAAPIYYGKKISVILDAAFLRHPRWFTRGAAWYSRVRVTPVARTWLDTVRGGEFKGT